MARDTSRLSSGLATIVEFAVKLRRDENGTIAVLMAVLLPVLVGTLGLGFEVSNWYRVNRSMQDAADSATIAAVTNGGSNYDVEARGVAAQYGFTDGVNNVTVTASNTVACPSGGNTCYSVTISGLVPLYLSEVVGFKGNATVNGVAQRKLSAMAVAKPGSTPTNFCLLALGSSGAQGIRTNGDSTANMAGCNVVSDTSANCNGHNLKAAIGIAHTTNSGCGIIQQANQPVVADPYSGLASNIPTNTCPTKYPSNTYAQEPTKKNGSWSPPARAENQWSGSKSLNGNVQVCGDLQLTGNVTINAPAGAVLVIENGQLDTNGFTISTSSGSALTVVFSGTNGGSYTHAPTNNSGNSIPGTLDIAAPTSGPWSGVAVYQDPKLTTGVNIAAAGNNPTWKITGLTYLPNSSVTFSGAVNKASNGQSCFVMVADNVTFSGTGDILESGGCTPAGLTMPTKTIPSRGHLVM